MCGYLSGNAVDIVENIVVSQGCRLDDRVIGSLKRPFFIPFKSSQKEADQTAELNHWTISTDEHLGNIIGHRASELKRLSVDEMAQDEPPDERFYYLLPPRTQGYNLRGKK
jgi:hypothetical protein